MATVTLTPSQSVFVSLYNANENFNTYDKIRVGVGSSTSSQYIGLLQFTLPPAIAVLNSATLRLYSYSDSCYQAAVILDVFRNIAAWDQAAVTWNTKPSKTDANKASKSVSGYDTWHTWDVSALIRDILANANYGMQIIQNGTTIERSKCYKRSGTYAPQLVLDYTEGLARIRDGGVIRQAIPYIKDGGVIRQAIPYVKDGGVWRIGG